MAEAVYCQGARRGVIGSVDRAMSMCQERLFDLRYGTDTVVRTYLKSLTIDSPNVALGVEYADAVRLCDG